MLSFIFGFKTCRRPFINQSYYRFYGKDPLFRLPFSTIAVWL
jgi:hypothetical protein